METNTFTVSCPVVVGSDNVGRANILATSSYWIHNVRVLDDHGVALPDDPDRPWRIKVAGVPFTGGVRPVLQGQTVALEIPEPRRDRVRIQVEFVMILADMCCPLCGAEVKWSCGASSTTGTAECQDGRTVSRRLPGRGEPCLWRGARVIRVGDDVVPDPTDPRWMASTSA